MSVQLKKDYVYQTIKNRINSGIFSIGSKIPSGLEIAKELEVSHITVRAALKQLNQENFVEFINGRGTFVADRNKLKSEKKILVLYYNNFNELSPAHYIIPNEFNRCCERVMHATEMFDLNLLRILDEKAINGLKAHNYQAVLLSGIFFKGNEKELDILRSLNIPVLLCYGSSEDLKNTNFSVLRIDIQNAWEAGIKYLTCKSFKKIALLLNNFEMPRGFTIEEHKNLLEKYGAEPSAELIKQAVMSTDNIDDDEIYAIVKELMSSPHKPEVIYCYSDFFARAVYLACRKLKLCIPQDVSVMGFGGCPAASLMNPALSTIDFDYANFGKKACELLTNNEININEPKEFIMPYKMMDRESTIL